MQYIETLSSLSREKREAIGLLSIGTFLEYFDLLLYVHMAVLLNELFFPKTDPHTAALLSAFAFCSYYILRPLGALIFGYLGETEFINKFASLTFGFIPFILYFWLIYENYAKYSNFGKKLFYYFFIVWTFYGIVAYFPYYLRNSCYNILDLFAKNFFGLYLSYLIIQQSLIL